MQNLEGLKRWLKDGISENSLMLHGTSIETVFELTNTGKIPTGILEIGDDYIYDRIQNRLFFSPVSSRFKGKKYERLAHMNKDDCFEDAKTYASFAGFINCLAYELNCQIAETYTILRHWENGSIGWEEIQTGLQKHGIELSIEKIIELHENARKRKGVIIEPNELILELPHEVAEDDNMAICVECPEGLDKRYVNGIELLGPVEERLMRRFLDGKLEYKGFKAELPEEYQYLY